MNDNKPNATLPKRRSLRLKAFDYTQSGAYFVTVCTQGKNDLFGTIVDGQMQATEFGRVVGDCWQALPNHFPNVQLDAFIVMPNHIHGILIIDSPERARHAVPLQSRVLESSGKFAIPVSGALSTIIRSFKSAATKRINECGRGAASRAQKIWQRNYFEHVIRNDESLDKIREYILKNPFQWEFDRENPFAVAETAESSAKLKYFPVGASRASRDRARKAVLSARGARKQ